MVTQAFVNGNKTVSVARQAYEQKKATLINQYLKLIQSKSTRVELDKNTSNLFRYRKNKNNKINVKNFNNFISIDPVTLVAEVEGMMTYDQIVKETLKYGFLPTVVPELKSITIGGALSGIGIESSSFRYGLVHETILEYEVLLGDGRVVICRPDNEYKDLYYAFPNSYGTLGYALKVKVKLIKAKKFIKLTHTKFTHPKNYFSWLEKICNQNRLLGSSISYIDGVIFDKNTLYGILGEFVDEAPYVSDYKYLNIFYQSIKQKQTDYLTTADYIWRWDTDWFWCSKHFFMQNTILRFLFGKFMLKSTVYWKMKNFFNKNKFAQTLSELKTGPCESVIQDVDIPIQKAESFLDFFQNEIGIQPIWICPIKAYAPDVRFNFYALDPNTLYINFGFWDLVPSQKPDGFYNKKIERMVETLGGKKSLYSSVYYTRNEFWNIYNKAEYLKLKEKYDPTDCLENYEQKLCLGE